mgnify:CR=1 FL=1
MTNNQTIRARDSFNGTTYIDCAPTDIALVWEKELGGGRGAATMIRTFRGQQFQADGSFDQTYEALDQSGETFLDAQAILKDRNSEMYLFNIRAAEIVSPPTDDAPEDFHVTIKGTTDNLRFRPLNTDGVPLTLQLFEQIQAEIMQEYAPLSPNA